MPETVDLTAWRNVPFQEEYAFTDDAGLAVDFTGYSAALEVRQYGGQPGAAQIALMLVSDGASEGVWFTGEPGAVRVTIFEASLASLPAPPEAGGEVALVYDLVLTDPTGFQAVWMQGAFTLDPGVTV
ncbi:MAG TPA: hypothetical protein VGF77_08520 [Allosphingosinicella sp.]